MSIYYIGNTHSVKVKLGEKIGRSVALLENCIGCVRNNCGCNNADRSCRELHC